MLAFYCPKLTHSSPVIPCRELLTPTFHTNTIARTLWGFNFIGAKSSWDSIISNTKLLPILLQIRAGKPILNVGNTNLISILKMKCMKQKTNNTGCTINGESVTLELRKDLPSSIGNWQAVAFYDAAHNTINHAPWRSGTNDATLQGVGLGLSWQNSDLWSTRMSIAAPVGNETKLLSPSSIGPRVWAEVRKNF